MANLYEFFLNEQENALKITTEGNSNKNYLLVAQVESQDDAKDVISMIQRLRKDLIIMDLT